MRKLNFERLAPFAFVLITLFMGSTMLLGYEIFPLELNEKGEVVFSLDYPAARKVTLAGNFNNWDKDATLMNRDEMGIWYYNLKLAPGKYEYKFVVNDVEWIPSENIKFEIKVYQGRLIIEGGEGYRVVYEKKANLKVSDKIFLNGLYKFIGLPYYNVETKKGGIFKNRHILDLMPHIYINGNVFLDALLSFDSQNKDALALCSAKVAMHAGDLMLLLFNNYRTFYLNDPLRSLDEYIYTSDYVLFSYPIDFYNTRIEEHKFGYNYRGAVIRFLLKDIELKGFLLRPMFYNFDVSGGVLKKIFFETDELGIVGIIKKGIYDDSYYPDDANSIYLPPHYAKYVIDKSKLYLEDNKYYLTKLGIETYFSVNRFINIFGEYLKKRKEGGFYALTITSDGKDLPQNHPDYSPDGTKIYSKYVYFYNTSFEGEEFIVGAHILLKYLKEEISFGFDNTYFTPSFLDNIRPVIYLYKSITKLDLNKINLPVKADIEFKILQGDENLKYYNYGLKFDENNFYNIILPGCYKKIVIRNQISILPVSKLEVLLKLWFNKYYQQDIYFNKPDRWTSETIENYFILNYAITKKIEISTGMRHKYYNFSEYVKSDTFYSFKGNYFNFYVNIKYKIYKNFGVSLGYGIKPEIDELHYDGFVYYLNENISYNWPFFKDAEEKFSKQHFITLKGEIKF